MHVVWEDHRSGFGNADVRYSRSTDHGTNWLPADGRVDLDMGTRSAEAPVVCCDDTNVYVVWRDDRNAAAAGAAYDIYSRASTDAGATFAAMDVRVNGSPAGMHTASGPAACCASTRLHVTWTDNRSGLDDVWFNTSSDSGATFLGTDVRMDVGTAAGTVATASAHICCSPDGLVVVAWDDARPGGGNRDIYANFSSDHGATWQAPDVRIDTDTPAAGLSEFATPYSLCCDGGFFWMAWRDTRNAVGPGYDMFVRGNVP